MHQQVLGKRVERRGSTDFPRAVLPPHISREATVLDNIKPFSKHGAKGWRSARFAVESKRRSLAKALRWPRQHLGKKKRNENAGVLNFKATVQIGP